MSKLLNADGKLARWSKKPDDKQFIFDFFKEKFQAEKAYSEREVNLVIKEWIAFDDFVLIRRELIDNGILERNAQGSEYKLRQQ